MPSLIKKSRQRPMGLRAVVVIGLLTASSLVFSEDWGPSGSRAGAGAFDAQGLLFSAVYNDDPVAIRQVLTANATDLPGEVKGLALLTAVTEGRAKAVAELLRTGVPADPKTLQGRTPLLLAAGDCGDDKIAKLLLDAGANANVISNAGETPLSEATRIGDQTMVQLLLAQGAKNRSDSQR